MWFVISYPIIAGVLMGVFHDTVLKSFEEGNPFPILSVIFWPLFMWPVVPYVITRKLLKKHN